MDSASNTCASEPLRRPQSFCRAHLRRCSVTVVLCLAGTWLSGCATTGGQPLNLLSSEQERELGAELAAEIEDQETLLDNAEVQAYVRKIGDRIATVAPRQDVEYEFTVIDSPDTINAFALPGGHMYIYTGLMTLCGNEAELASVMAHEIAHVSEKHHGESLTRQYGYNLISRVILGEDPAAAAELVSKVVATGVFMRFSRQHEFEADASGVEMLFRAGYKPEAMVQFMEKMQAKQDGPSPPVFFRSHPLTEDRVAQLRAMVQRYPLDMRIRSPLYADRYAQEVLNKLD